MGAILIVVGGLLAALVAWPKKAYASPATGKTPLNSIDSLIKENSTRYGVPTALIKAVIKTESDFNPEAVNPKDPSYGLMQIMPILAEDFGIVRDWRNVTDAEVAMIKLPSKNIQIGTWFLSKLLKKYPMEIAVQMYNVGEAGYNSGKRASAYLEKVTRYYNDYISD